MAIVETTIAIILAQIPTYFIQRYFFKSVMDKSLDKFEDKLIKLRTRLIPIKIT